jgi:hypothetical protein
MAIAIGRSAAQSTEPRGQEAHRMLTPGQVQYIAHYTLYSQIAHSWAGLPDISDSTNPTDTTLDPTDTILDLTDMVWRVG